MYVLGAMFLLLVAAILALASRAVAQTTERDYKQRESLLMVLWGCALVGLTAGVAAFLTVLAMEVVATAVMSHA